MVSSRKSNQPNLHVVQFHLVICTTASLRLGRPVPKQEWTDEGDKIVVYDDDHRESWIDLFVDLTFVALLINLRYALLHHPNCS